MFPTFLTIVPPISAEATAKNIGVLASPVITHEHISFPLGLRFWLVPLYSTKGSTPASGWLLGPRTGRWLAPRLWCHWVVASGPFSPSRLLRTGQSLCLVGWVCSALVILTGKSAMLIYPRFSELYALLECAEACLLSLDVPYPDPISSSSNTEVRLVSCWLTHLPAPPGSGVSLPVPYGAADGCSVSRLWSASVCEETFKPTLERTINYPMWLLQEIKRIW